VAIRFSTIFAQLLIPVYCNNKMGIALRLPCPALVMSLSAYLGSLRRKMVIARLLGYRCRNTNCLVQCTNYSVRIREYRIWKTTLSAHTRRVSWISIPWMRTDITLQSPVADDVYVSPDCSIMKLLVLPTECICLFCTIQKEQTWSFSGLH
jgi:hypothetical protein